MREYARITGQAEMPPLWAFGYMQSHRTLGGPDEILGVARTFREKKLPCDTLIYLGTEFAPSGWNTRNGEFTWHPTNFPDPKKMLDQLHADHFRVVVHVVVAVPDEAEHEQHFYSREISAVDRTRDKYLARLEEIRRIQDFIVREAGREGVTVIENDHVEQAVATVIELVFDRAAAVEQLA